MSKPSLNSENSAIRHVSLATYVSGYAASLYLTITAYFLVRRDAFSRRTLITAVVGLALAQFLVQLVCFLHLGRETKPRWKLVVFLFMIVVVCILVFGSLWIMNNLNYRSMTPAQINQYMNSQDNL